MTNAKVLQEVDAVICDLCGNPIPPEDMGDTDLYGNLNALRPEEPEPFEEIDDDPEIVEPEPVQKKAFRLDWPSFGFLAKKRQERALELGLGATDPLPWQERQAVDKKYHNVDFDFHAECVVRLMSVAVEQREKAEEKMKREREAQEKRDARILAAHAREARKG
jgi:hypothetical protein